LAPLVDRSVGVARAAEVGDATLPAGEMIVMWYWSSNRHESLFTDGKRFEGTRANGRDHVSFGVRRPHFCLGANLAGRKFP
jgi:cytochrome P450